MKRQKIWNPLDWPTPWLSIFAIATGCALGFGYIAIRDNIRNSQDVAMQQDSGPSEPYPQACDKRGASFPGCNS